MLHPIKTNRPYLISYKNNIIVNSENKTKAIQVNNIQRLNNQIPTLYFKKRHR